MRVLYFICAIFLAEFSAAEETYSLEQLGNTAQQYPASSELRGYMLSLSDHRAELLRCKEEKRWGLENVADFFAAREIKLSDSPHPAYLVFPAKYCPAFFGAHAVAFWIVQKTPDEKYVELHSYVTDSVAILDKRTNAYRDIATTYGFEKPKRFRFNGKRYQ